ncbi:SpoIID/LytB domain-containing protein, partial [Candidatus Uhrbacteria bacterium]|nr:SpoIID/LytB domain-containing protein [Candidatus Uhrbacteria bacterium]
VAVALVIVLATARGLGALEARLDTMDATALHGWLGIRTAHAAALPQAPLLIRSHQMPITAPAGSTIGLTLGFKNMSGRPWVRATGSTALLEREQRNGPSIFLASTWIDTMRPTFQQEPTVTHGAIAFFTAEFRVPVDPGTYTDRFVLRALDGVAYDGSAMEVAIIASPTPNSQLPAPSSTAALASMNVFGAPTSATGTDGTDPNFIPFLPRYTTEPIMRVGLVYHEPTNAAWDPHRVRSTVPLRVTTADGHEVVTVPANTTASMDYRPRDGTYHLQVGTDWYTVAQPIRFTPTTPALVELMSYTKQLQWESKNIDNHFKGILEVRYVPSTERLWAINELPLEDYLRGLVETSDDAPPEFHKAQIVAARTFALYHIARGGKYPLGQFVLTGTASDQVYRGEEAGLRRPNLVRAVEETRGIVATYDGDVVVTPYYAQSDGRTRTWEQVWGGKPKAWLTSAADPVCEGKRKIGHGVGMPQRCAMELARQGWTFQAILKNYYQGIALEKVYE